MADSQRITIDPEVEEILRAVAADPSSTLLRVPRPSSIRGLVNRYDGVSAATAGLTSAERHLVRTCRSDVARLFLEACRMKLIDGPDGIVHISPFGSNHQDYPRLRPEELALRVDQARVMCAISAEEDSWHSVLDRCVIDPLGSSPTVVQLAEASLRLEPTDEARVMAALDMSEHGAPESAIRTLKYVLSVTPPQKIALCAWNNLGMAYTFLHRMVEAHECHAIACTVDAERLEPWLNRLVIGLQLGLTSDARQVCSVVEEMASSAERNLENFINSKRIQRRRGDWYPTESSRRSLGGLKSDYGPAIRRLLSVFD